VVAFDLGRYFKLDIKERGYGLYFCGSKKVCLFGAVLNAIMKVQVL
jgi:hypothetical protein